MEEMHRARFWGKDSELPYPLWVSYMVVATGNQPQPQELFKSPLISINSGVMRGAPREEQKTLLSLRKFLGFEELLAGNEGQRSTPSYYHTINESYFQFAEKDGRSLPLLKTWAFLRAVTLLSKSSQAAVTIPETGWLTDSRDAHLTFWRSGSPRSRRWQRKHLVGDAS